MLQVQPRALAGVHLPLHALHAIQRGCQRPFQHELRVGGCARRLDEGGTGSGDSRGGGGGGASGGGGGAGGGAAAGCRRYCWRAAGSGGRCELPDAGRQRVIGWVNGRK